MRSIGGLGRAIAAAALLCVASAHAQTAAPPPIEAFGRLPAVADAALSPDGSKVALALTSSTGSAIRVIDVGAGSVGYTGGVDEDTQLRGVGWASDTHVSFRVSRTFHPGEILPANVTFRGRPRRVDYWRTGIVDLATQRSRVLTTNAEDAWQDQGSYLVAPIAGDGGHARMVGSARGASRYQAVIHRVNLATGRSMLFTARGATDDTIYYLFDEAGAVTVRIDSDRATNRWQLFVYDGDQPRKLMEDVSQTGAPVDVQGFLPDGRLVVLDDEGDGFSRLYAVNRTTGAKQVLFERPRLEIAGAITDPWTRQVVGAAWTEDEAKQHFFDPALQAAYQAVLPSFADGAVLLSSWSRDRSRVLLYGEHNFDGGGYYLYRGAGQPLARIAMLYPELAQAELQGQRQSITYRARDGTTIPAYLTVPPLDEARNLPLVLLVHGGPHGVRETLSFDWWAAFLASRGYAVLQSNYRGSGGFGREWEWAGRRQWGGLMQTDIEDGVTALVRARIADPARICIVGASYGGYAALAGATLTPDRYKCAASISGVSDLNDMLSETVAQAGRDSMSADYLRLSIGDPVADRDAIRAVSPVNLADRVQIPVLLVHGADDTVVPIAQSQRMYERLTGAGKNVRFVRLQNDDHWLSDSPTRVQMLRELDTFLAQHIGPQAQR